MQRARIRLAAVVTTSVLFVSAWVAVARWGDRSVPVGDRSQPAASTVSTSGATESDSGAFFDDEGEEEESGPVPFPNGDSVAPVQAPVPSTQS